MTSAVDRDQRPIRASQADAWVAELAVDDRRPSHVAASDEWGGDHALGAGRARWREREIAALAARQRALISHGQLVGLGVGRSSIWRAIQRGRLHRLHKGIYSLVPPHALPELAAEQAAILACGDDTVVSGHSAAFVWEMQKTSPTEVSVIVIGHDRGRKLAGIRVRRVSQLHRADVRAHRGLPVTSPARALLDIAPELAPRERERTFDEAIARRVVSRSAVLAVLARYPRHKGAAALRELCQESSISRSSGEKELLKLIRRAGLPTPETNAKFGRFEIDFLWRSERVALELDGYDFHRSRAALERDHAKDMALQAAGFIVVRVTGRQLARQPEMVLAWVAAALARAAARLA